jgi:hypothetical protein
MAGGNRTIFDSNGRTMARKLVFGKNRKDLTNFVNFPGEFRVLKARMFEFSSKKRLLPCSDLIANGPQLRAVSAEIVTE